MGTNPLWDHYLRLVRADKHVRAVEQLILAYRESQPYGVTYESHSEQREVAISVSVPDPVNVDATRRRIGVVVSDFLNQLRSALDNMASLMTERSGLPPPSGLRNPERSVYFPIVTDAGRWAETRAKVLWGIPDEALATFRDVQPFVTGEQAPKREPLAVLQELSNRDKHRTPTLISVDIGLPELVDLPQLLGLQEVFKLSGPFEHGKEEVEVLRYRYPSGTDMKTLFSELDEHLRYTFDVAFDKMPPWIPNRALIMKTLQLLQQHTLIVLNKFQPYFPPE